MQTSALTSFDHDGICIKGGVVYKTAEQMDDDDLKSILRQNPMNSWVSLSTEHEPSYFSTRHLFGDTYTIVARQDNKQQSVVGMCSSVSMQVHINGESAKAGYLGELRVMPAYRNKLRIVRNGFQAVRELNKTHKNLPYWFTSIAMENTVARRLLEANLKGMPLYQPQGEMLTIALSTKRSRDNDFIQQASLADVPEIVSFFNQQARHYQYSPVLDERWLLSLDGSNGLQLSDFWILKQDGRIQSCFALWDQRLIKQTVVRGYRFPLNIVRRPYNLYANLTGLPSLPAIGKSVEYIFIAFLAINERVWHRTEDIIQSALSKIKQRNAEVALLGISAHNPIYKCINHFPGHCYHTCIESVTWPEQEPKEPGTSPVQPEVAVL